MIKGISQYDAMRIYIDELAIAFEQEGNLCTVLDGTSKAFQDDLIETLQNHSYDFVLTCNGIFMSPAVRKLLKTKYCTWIFDHPIHHMERLQQGDENTFVLCCDRNNVNYVRRFFPNITHVDFVPLSGSCVEDIVPYRQRTIDLVFTGSNLMAEDAMKSIQEQPGPIKDIALEMVDMIHSNSSLTLEESLAIALNNHNIDVDDQHFQDILFCTKDVGRYMRAFYREKIVQTIVEAGIPIHVFGSGWDKCEFSKKSNFIQCKGYGQTSLRTVANAKISLNVMPWFKDGFQERIAAAMLNGAVSLTDSSKYITENFIDRENIRLYSLDKIELIPSIIQELLDDVDFSERIAQSGYCIAKAQHTYKNRVRQILKILT